LINSSEKSEKEYHITRNAYIAADIKKLKMAILGALLNKEKRKSA
jgi:hypothetical protein